VMKKISSMVFVGAVGALMGGCATYDLAGTKAMAPSGSAFSQELYKGYLYQAELEDDENDYPDAAYFLDKASRSAEGEEVAPDEFFDKSQLPERNAVDVVMQRELPPEAQGKRLLPADGAARATEMRGQLDDKLGMASTYPALVAELQVAYDCYLQEKEENNQPADIHECEEDFEAALAKFPVEQMPEMPPPAPLDYVVYFDLDSAVLDGAAMAIVREAATAAMDRDADVVVAGHTDTSGSESYNMSLSKRRAVAVAQVLESEGVDSRRIEVDHYGESDLAMATGDGVVARENRRVTIFVK